jgi:hypothetical protein
MTGNWQGTFNGVVIPSVPSFMITREYQRFTLTGVQASLGATDTYGIYQFIEGPQWRELGGDVTSLSLLVRSSVSGLKFSAALRDANSTVSLVKLCTIPSANTWTLITLPNIPLPSSGTFNYQPGQVGYILNIMLSVGSTYIAPAADTWQNGVFIGAPGMDNFCGKTNGSTFDLAFHQHEPGALCTTPIDCPFTQNYDDCLRYFQKTYDYGTKPGTVTNNGALSVLATAAQNPYGAFPFKRTLAKNSPTLTGYSPMTGAAGAVRDLNAAIDRSISGGLFVGDSGHTGFALSTTNAASALYIFHYTADAGW